MYAQKVWIVIIQNVHLCTPGTVAELMPRSTQGDTHMYSCFELAKR